MDVCGLRAFGNLKFLDELEETNRFFVVELVVNHVDITITGFIELDVVGGVEVIMAAAVVLGAEVGGFSILLTLYCLLLAWWFLLLLLMSLAFLFWGAFDFAGGGVVGLSG